MKLLHIDASILNEQSASRQLTTGIVKRLIQVTPGVEVVYNDLAAEPIGHLSTAEFLAFQEGGGPGRYRKAGGYPERQAPERLPRIQCHRHWRADVQLFPAFATQGLA